MTTINLELAHKVLQDKSASIRLKHTVMAYLEKDPVDAQNDIEILNKIFMGEKV